MLPQSPTPIKIGIVEDEVIIADNIYGLLQDLGYNPSEPCCNYDDAITMLINDTPDLVLLDINLTRGKNGIEIAEYIRNNHNIPFIFLTANSDKATLHRAKTTCPSGYLVKPFQKADLYAAIEVASYNYSHRNAITFKNQLPSPDSGYLFIKDGNYFYKVAADDILYLCSDHVYLSIHTAARKYLVRGSMQEYLSKLPRDKFVRIHRSYAVNRDKINKINSVYIEVSGEQLPLSRNHRENLMEILNIA